MSLQRLKPPPSVSITKLAQGLNPMSNLSDTDIERALDYLRDSADEAAQARAERVYLDEFRKCLKSQIMKEHADQSGIVQEREAYADERYLRHVEALREAVHRDEKHRFLLKAAEAKIDAWRSKSANQRAMKI